MPDIVSAELLAQIRKQIEHKMTDLKITDFRAKTDFDHDGDPIIRLEIIYDDAGGQPRPKLVSALARHSRPWPTLDCQTLFRSFDF